MGTEKQIPVEKGLDHTLHLLLEGYLFIQNRCDRLDTHIFQTNLLGETVICISGEKSAKLFYNDEYFQRKGAAPKRIQKSLFGENGIQTMDEKDHSLRKQFFMSFMTSERINLLIDIVKDELYSRLDYWINKGEIILFEEMKMMLASAACRWTEVPLQYNEVKQKADDLYALVDAFGAVGVRHWKGRIARNRLEKWMMKMIGKIRSGASESNKDSMIHQFANLKNIDGQLVSEKMAAIELINILRPIVAIATYITFAAAALHDNPEMKKKIKPDAEFTDWFIQEVRRYYPFGPFLGARVKKDFQWEGYRFTEGTLVLLDIYGTNHSFKTWKNPKLFWPERFKDWDQNPYSFIPQGGGDFSDNHRCAGEKVTIEVMKETIVFLTNQIEFETPQQDLGYSLKRMPALPRSGFIMKKIRKK